MNHSFVREILVYVVVATSILFNLDVTFASDNAPFRLSENIQPSFQQISLKVDPDSPEFSGKTTISIDVLKDSPHVGFYQSGLEIVSATLIDGNQEIPLKIRAAAYNINNASADQIILAKRYDLHIVFKGKINLTSDGLYLSKFEKRNYLFTQFEDMHARKAFPSFDEPSFKIPYQMTISAPQKHVVVSNTPVLKRSTKDGWQTVEFSKTKPMPSYLLAIAVGEMDSAEIVGLSVPGKIYTPKGLAHRTKYVAKHTPKILTALENYFGIDYPYQKLDFVAVPNFTHGAMENAGLITYRSGLLLLDDEPRLVERARPLMVIAHEIAHQWYGNLVTMAWWDDLWLNEAFASWMASKIMLDLYPEHNYADRLVQERAFTTDASPTTKPVKKLVRSQTDVMDGLSLNYSKGESVLQLIESLVGEQAFQKAVQKYMQVHAWQNTSADDLWAVLAEFSDFDVPAMMQSYLEQPGYPLISLNETGTLSQQRFTFAGTKVEQQKWRVPITLRYKKGGKTASKSFLFSTPSLKIPELEGVDWVHLDDNARGYFRWQIPTRQMGNLLKDSSSLNKREKKSVLYNADALLKANTLSLNDYMNVLASFAQDQDPTIARAVVAALKELIYLVDDSNKMEFARFIDRKLLTWFEKLGVEEANDDSDDISRLRNSVFGILGTYGNNKKVLETSETLADRYLKDFDSVPRSIAGSALASVAKRSKGKWIDRFVKAHTKTNDANVQLTIAGAMIFPQEENIVKVLNFALSDQVGPADARISVAVASNAKQEQDAFYDWLESNFTQLVSKMPEYHVARLPETISRSCEASNIAMAKKLYQNRKSKYEGMQRSFNIAIAKSEQCLALKTRFQDEFTTYLRKSG